MKKILSYVTAAVLALSLTVCGVMTTYAAEAAKARIGFITQEYIDDNIAEIPYIEYDGAKNKEIDAINRSLNQGIRQVYDEFMENVEPDRDWIEIKSYPFTTERYLQVVVTHIIYPNYGTDGEMFSINYDMDENAWITTEDALAAEGLEYDDVYANVEELFEPEFKGMYISDLKIAGFLIHELAAPFLGREDSYVEFLLEVTVENPEADPWISFYSYSPLHESLISLNPMCLFDPFDMDETDEPLSYIRNLDEFDSWGAGQLIDNTETGIGMMIDDFEDGNYVEIMFFQYDGQQAALEEYNWRNPEIEMINNIIQAEPWLIYDGFINDELETDGSSIEIRSYPFADEDFVQIIITCVVYPETMPDLYTKLWSYNFGREDNMYIMLEDVLEGHSMDQDDIYDLFADWYDGEAALVDVQATGFLIEGNIAHFLLEVMLEGESDPYKEFYMYTPDSDEFVWLDPLNLFGDMFNAPPIWLLTADMSAFEWTDDNVYTMDGLLFVELDSFPPQTYDMYDEETLEARILELTDGEAYDIVITLSEEYSEMLTYPAWLAAYTRGHNEDTRFCADLYFQADNAEYRAHTDVHADSAEEYEDVISELFQSLNLVEPVYVYLDTDNMLELFYAARFASFGEPVDDGAIVFGSAFPYDDTRMVYSVSPDSDAQAELIESADMTESKELADGSVVGWGEYLDAETDETTYAAYLFIVDPEEYFLFEGLEVYPVVMIICESEEMAAFCAEWFEAGDIYILFADGLDAYHNGISEDEAMELLCDAIYYKLDEGLALVSYGPDDMGGIPCWSFALGEDSPEKFTALEHYVVTLDGEIYVLDITTGEYEPFVFG